MSATSSHTAHHVSEAALEAAVAEFAKVVGAENVHRGDETAAEFADPYGNPDAGSYYWAAAVVQPATVEEVRDVVRIANQFDVPLWTSSTGRNFGYGGGAPRVPGSIALSLRRMNRILEVNEKLGYALVEPGVSYLDLYGYLRSHGHRLWVDTPDLGWGSVIGNSLDHGYGYTPYGDHGAMACGLEVVLANGDTVRTGMGAMSGSRAWQVQKRGFGPSLDAIFAQSNFGIVTKMGIWLMPQPDVWRVSWVYLEKDEQLSSFIEALRPLLVKGLINHRVPVRKGLVPGPSANGQGHAQVRPDMMDAIGEHVGFSAWNTRIALYGTEEIVEANFAELKRVIATVPGARVESTKYAGDVDPTQVHTADRVFGGIPNLEFLNMLKWFGTDTGGHLDFTAVAPLDGDDAAAIMELLEEHVSTVPGLSLAPAFALQSRAMYLISMILFDYAKPDDVKAAHHVVARLVEEAGKRGYGAYRAHLNMMDLVGQQYDYNDHAGRRLNEILKDALDPNGILSPGKQGIWPQRYRRP